MPLYRPTELIDFLRSLGVAPKKSLSQNFLIDGNILQKIISLAEASGAETIIEIGPGPGALTEALLVKARLSKGCRVIAIEKDHLFAKALPRLDQQGDLLQVVEEDVLRVSFDEMLGDKKGQIIANIPYHITSEIIEKILFSKQIVSATLLVQVEVAERILAVPGSKQFDLLSLLVNYYCVPHYGFEVPKRCFYPIPKVTSAVVHLEMKKRWSTPYEDVFLDAVRYCFTHRRKMVKTALRELFDEKRLNAIFSNRLAAVRPDELSCQEWVSLIEQLQR